MYRLVGNAFEEDKELQNLAVLCLTETVKAHLEHYFEEGYEDESVDTLYTKVNLKKVKNLLPIDMVVDMELIGVNPESFVPKKIGQFMALLKDNEEHTPDLFLEYILYQMIEEQSKKGFDIIPLSVVTHKPELKKLINNYVKEYMDYENTKERNRMVKEYIMRLTDFKSLLGDDELNLESLVYWDWDFKYFDGWGFTEVMKQSAGGLVLDYGLEYTKTIFTSVGEDLPFFLEQARR